MKLTSGFFLKASFLLSLPLFLLVACSKNSENTPPSQKSNYQNMTPGSSWVYHQSNLSSGTSQETDFTLTSSTSDTMINSRKYHIYNYSFGGSQSLAQDGINYYRFDTLPAQSGGNIELLYLKNNVKAGDSWVQNITVSIPQLPMPVPITVTNTVLDIGNRTVGTNSYNKVIHVKTILSTTLIPSTNFVNNIDSYYAPDFGLIENTTIMKINYLGFVQDINMKTTLTSANLK